ncbi:acyl-CoA N-acyltransferase [Xylariaceae sp. AK1471]|nr:acyl-CoA N-acyltransferase [Xylariaceae sp. AK1471]
MSLPSSNANGQPSIRNFFRPRQPSYAAPPSAPKNIAPKNIGTQSGPTLSTVPPTATTTTTTETRQSTSTTLPSANGAAPSLPPPANLHPQASIARIQPEHIPALRRITSLLLPVNYPDSFYARLSDPLSAGAFSRVILWRDDNNPTAPEKVIGGLVCRPEPSPFHAGTVDAPPQTPRGPTTPSAQPNALYIQSLVLLSPYRGLGLAAVLLDEVVADAARSEFACETVWAHVWTQNEEGLRWYMARGFSRVDEVKGYYFKLRPDSAWIIRREIGPGALLRLDGSATSASREEVKTIKPSSSVTAAVANFPLNAPGGVPSSSPGVSPPPLLPRTLPTSGALPATAPPSGRPSPSPLPNSGRSTPGQSFQNMRPETEWNDLPLDMQLSSNSLSVPGSGASSRSSSAVRKKRDRAYPAAAFSN